MSLYIIFARTWTGRYPVDRHAEAADRPEFFGDAFSIFLLRQFFMTIPQELSDAIRVDGGNELRSSGA